MYKPIGKHKCDLIKYLVEKHSGFKDIGIKSRDDKLPDLKKIYCKLCKEHTKASLKTIADSLSYCYNHASVLYNINKFDDLLETNQLHHVQVYNSVSEVLNHTTLKKDKETYSKYMRNFTLFLDWYRKEANETITTDSIYFVKKYLSKEDN